MRCGRALLPPQIIRPDSKEAKVLRLSILTASTRGRLVRVRNANAVTLQVEGPPNNVWPSRHLFDAGAAMQVGLDPQACAAAESRAIDLQVLHDPLHVIAGLGERDQLDPVNRVDLGIARIAVTLDPFFDAA